MTRPEPAWWAEARRLRAEGEREGRPWTHAALAAHLGKAETSIRRALNDDYRAKDRKGVIRRRAEKRAEPGFREARSTYERTRYANDPEYRARRKAKSRQYHARRKAERIAAE